MKLLLMIKKTRFPEHMRKEDLDNSILTGHTVGKKNKGKPTPIFTKLRGG